MKEDVPVTANHSSLTPSGLTTSGDLHVAADTMLPANVHCDGHVTLGARARVRGNLTASGAVRVGPEARIDGVVHARGPVHWDATAEAEGLASSGPLHVGGRKVAGAVDARGGILGPAKEAWES